jgi:hypothetical protein
MAYKLTPQEQIALVEHYSDKGKQWCIDNLHISDNQIRYYAQKFNLPSNFKHNTESDFNRGSGWRGKKRPKHTKYLKDNHSMKGKHHSIKTKKILSQKSTQQMLNNNCYSRVKRGYFNIDGKEIYFRSKWEANYALYLNFLIAKKEIKSWTFETETFWFEKIRRGVRSYTPDFKVVNNNDSVTFHEVKGWMDAKSKTKIKRMAKYYPETKLIIIDGKCYKDIIKKTPLKFYE